MSVPTIFGRVSGYTSTMIKPKKVPLPTDVSPTTKPNTAPIVVARILSRRFSRNGASLGWTPRLIAPRSSSPSPPATSAPPTA